MRLWACSELETQDGKQGHEECLHLVFINPVPAPALQPRGPESHLVQSASCCLLSLPPQTQGDGTALIECVLWASPQLPVSLFPVNACDQFQEEDRR